MQKRENYITRHPEKRDHGETKKQPAYERKAGITRKGSKRVRGKQPTRARIQSNDHKMAKKNGRQI